MVKQDPPLTYRQQIGLRLRITREAFGLPQGEFAKRAGIEPNTYNNWETGDRVPDLTYALRLCETYGLTLDWIYRGEIKGLPFQLGDDLRRRQSSS
jgi:transcriptional regulator with XRE-family HTH domain